jgi:hypothetical protein
MVQPEKRFPIEIVPTCAEQSDANVAVTFCFGDDSIAVLTFSAKGHSFAGVRERFAAHKGDLLASLDEFKTLTIEVVERKRTYRARHRDHGHERRVRASYSMVSEGAPGAAVSYVWETGILVLKTDEALKTRSSIVIQPYEASLPKEAAGV